MSRSDPVAPEILEIRVHGVKNTPPAEMLETTSENIQRVTGDNLGSFWRRVDERPAHGIATTEAFSWGSQARTGGDALAVIGRAFVHVGWFLLLPFALANLAYWTRRIGMQASAGSNSWNGDSGAATVRIFALLLTLITVSAFSSVAVDLVAIQCFPADQTQLCAALPSFFDGFRVLDRDSREALFGLVPIAAILVLYVIGRRGRVQFEERINKFGKDLGNAEAEEGRPLLSTRGFWSTSRIRQTTEWLHVAAAITLVLFLLALDSAYIDECRRVRSTLTWRCVEAGLRDPLSASFGIGAIVLMIAIVILIGVASHTGADKYTVVKRGLAMTCLLVAIAGYIAWTILVFQPTVAQPGGAGSLQPDAQRGFLGLIVTPIGLIVLALFLALGGVGWNSRSRPRRAASLILLSVGAVALLFTHFLKGDVRWAYVAVAILCILIHLSVAWSTPGDRRFQAWRGQGAAVAMILALFASMALSSLLVLGTAAWLSSPASRPDTENLMRTPVVIPPDDALNVPDAYERFAVLLTGITVLMLLVVLLALGWNLVRFVSFSLPALAWKPPEYEDDEGTAAERGGTEEPDPRAYPGLLRHPETAMRSRVSVRRNSHLAHRGEPLFGWLAVFAAIGFLSLSTAVTFQGIKDVAASISPALPSGLRATSTAVLAAVALAAVAAVVVHATSSSERPLAVFWDVVAFLPRAGHPFSPACYGERVVPELAARTKSWLNDEHADRPRAVIFGAHSMGSTITVATLLALRGEPIVAGPLAGTDIVERTALLSYGSQLRGYFSRFFPSVFGPGVLGVPGVLAPSLWRRDPWRDQIRVEFADDYTLPRPAQASPDRQKGSVPAAQVPARLKRHAKRALPRRDEVTLTALLGAEGQEVPRWRNLWRRTDYLGFPVYGYRDDGNPVDRGTTESAPSSYLWRIARHSDYLGTTQYLLARDELVAAFCDADAGPGKGAMVPPPTLDV